MITTFLLLLFSSSANAQESFTINNAIVPFADYPKLELMISENCVKGINKFSCQAFSATKEIKIREKDYLSFSGNPHTVACEISNSKTVIGTDSKGNENSFCSFSDGSLIDAGSLFYYGVRNGRDIL